MNLEDMNIDTKRNQLEGLLNKSIFDGEYTIQVRWFTTRQEDQMHIKNLIDGYDALFRTGNIKRLELEEQNKAFNNYNREFDRYLKIFPEYANIDNHEKNGPHM